MPRPGAVIEVDRNTPPVLFHFGEGVRLEKMPLGARIIYPPDPLEPIAHPERAIKRAIAKPLEDDPLKSLLRRGMTYPPAPLNPTGHPERAIRRAIAKPLEDDPLKSLLRRGMKITIAFDDLSLPLPPMAAPDVRQLVMEEVIDMAAEAGIDDLHIIAALGLHRRMTEDEVRHIVGERIFTTFHPDRLYQHDGEDLENNVYVGKTAQGEEVTLNRRAAESDLVIYVNLTLVPMDGGHKSMSTGLASFRSIRAHHNAKTLLASRSYMNPPDSALHHSCIRQGQLIED